MAAYISHDQDRGLPCRTVRAFVSEFRGLSATAKVRDICETVGASRLSLAEFYGDGAPTRVGALLGEMRRQSRPIKPRDLGGNRRFLPVAVRNIDLDAVRPIVDALWAEAVALYRAGANWWGETEKLAHAEQQERVDIDPWEAKIAEAASPRRRRCKVASMFSGSPRATGGKPKMSLTFPNARRGRRDENGRHQEAQRGRREARARRRWF
jgi:Virulence-associated protein E